MLAQAIFQRAREVVAAGRRGSVRGAARGRRAAVDPRVEHRLFRATSPTRRSSTSDGIAVAHSVPTLEGQPMAEQEDLGAAGRRAGTLAQLRAVYSDRTLRDPRSRCSPATRQFGSIRIGVSTLLVAQRAAATRSAAPPAAVARRAARVDARRDAARAVDAAADPRDPERPDAPRTRRARRARSICRRQEFRDLGSSFDAVSAQLSAMVARPTGRLPCAVGDRLRVGRWTTSRTRWRCSRRDGRADVQQPGDERAAAASLDRPTAAPRQSRAAARRAHAGGAAIAGPGVAGVAAEARRPPDGRHAPSRPIAC